MIVNTVAEAVGTMSFHQVHYGPNSGSLAYNIGLNIVPTHRGQGLRHGSAAPLADYLLWTYPIARVEASTDVTNLPEQRSLEKAGFRREARCVAQGAVAPGTIWHSTARCVARYQPPVVSPQTIIHRSQGRFTSTLIAHSAANGLV